MTFSKDSIPGSGKNQNKPERRSANDETHQNNQALKRANDKLTLALNYAEAVVNTAHQPFLVLDKNLNILRANPAFYKAFKTTPETTEGRLLMIWVTDSGIFLNYVSFFRPCFCRTPHSKTAK
jgi:PAS domain-containing protein